MVPLTVAAPAAAASLAWLNAKYGISSDAVTLTNAFRSYLFTSRLEKTDRHNSFYSLEEHATNPKFANKQLLVFEGKSWTYKQVYENALRYGSWLRTTYKVQKNEIVALDCMNGPTFIFAWYGLWSIGAKPAFINYNLTGEGLLHCIRAATARLVLVDSDVGKNFTKDVVRQLSSPDFLEDGKGAVEIVWPKAIESEILSYIPTRQPDSARDGQRGRDMAMLIYTSGTTGLPKPALVYWDKINGVRSWVVNWLGLKETDRFYTAMPLYHSAGSVLGLMTSMQAGATFVLDRKFSTKTFWNTVRDSKATVFQYVGETCRYLLSAPASPLDRQHHIRIAFGNGLRPDIWDRFKERFGIEVIGEFYAATEGTGGSWNRSANSFTRGSVGRVGKIARLLLGSSAAVVELDPETEEPLRDPSTGFLRRVPLGSPGELFYKVPEEDIGSKFQGYYRNKAATDKKIMRDVLQKGDAWFRTGDVVVQDNEGRTFFHDRIGDTFRWKSENVSTNEVADALGRMPKIIEANVYGIAVPNHDGRAGCAALILDGIKRKEDEDRKAVQEVDANTLQEIANHALKELPRYAVPLFLRFTDELERTGTNKFMKGTLRSEGVEPAKTAKSGDRIYWLNGGTYKAFGEKEWKQLQSGQVKL